MQLLAGRYSVNRTGQPVDDYRIISVDGPGVNGYFSAYLGTWCIERLGDNSIR